MTDLNVLTIALAIILPVSAAVFANGIREGRSARHAETLAAIAELKALIQRSAR